MSLRKITAWDRKHGSRSAEGGRFAGLREALAVAKGNSVRLAAHVAEKNGNMPRTHQETPEPSTPRAANPKPAKTPAVPAPRKPSTATVVRQPWKVPAHVDAKGTAYAQSYREGFSRLASQINRLQGRPEARGRIGSLMLLATEDLSDSEILAKLPRTATDRDRAADAVWTRAYAMIARDRGINVKAAEILSNQRRLSTQTPQAKQILANQRATVGAPRAADRTAAADDVWARAYAHLNKNGARR